VIGARAASNPFILGIARAQAGTEKSC
jgi:hypothetical protein